MYDREDNFSKLNLYRGIRNNNCCIYSFQL